MSSAKEKTRKAIFGKLRDLRKKLNSQGHTVTVSRPVIIQGKSVLKA
jgi:hypothetical protein